MGTIVDNQWYSDLFQQCCDGLYSYCLHHIGSYPGSKEDAKDILQEVFILAWKKDISTHPNPKGWLFVTAKNLCRNYLRKSQRESKMNENLSRQIMTNQPAGIAAHFDGASEPDTSTVDLLLSLEQELSDDEMRIFRDYFIQQKTESEISVETGIPISTLRGRIFRMRKKLVERALLVIIMLCIAPCHFC